MNLTIEQLQLKSLRCRKEILRIIVGAGAGHTGGSLSCLDILCVLYNRVMNVSPRMRTDPNRDRYIQSKGHSVEALFVVLADCGYFPAAELDTLCRYQSHFVGHPTRKIPGVEHNTGGLGHGLSFGVGCALAARQNHSPSRTFVLLGDGELAEGSNWEAAMLAAHYKLDRLTAIVDHNTLQITGRTRDVCDLSPLDEKWRAFGWDVHTIDGHSIAALTDTLSSNSSGKPRVVIANTIKGRGVSFMQDVGKWHHGVPSAEEYAKAIAELDEAIGRS